MSDVVLLHGFTGSPASFDELERQLVARLPRLRTFRPALLGHAGTRAHGVRRFEQEIERLATSIRGAGFAGAHLLGYSLGARVALGLLAHVPYLFGGATLIGVHPGIRGLAERAARVGSDERWCERLAQHGLQAFLRDWEAQPLFASQHSLSERCAAEQREVRRGHTAEGLMTSLRVLGLGQMPDYRGVLSTQPLPVQLLAGALDDKFMELGRELADVSPRVELEIVAGVGHNVLLEAPGRVASALARALAA